MCLSVSDARPCAHHSWLGGKRLSQHGYGCCSAVHDESEGCRKTCQGRPQTRGADEAEFCPTGQLRGEPRHVKQSGIWKQHEKSALRAPGGRTTGRFGQQVILLGEIRSFRDFPRTLPVGTRATKTRQKIRKPTERPRNKMMEKTSTFGTGCVACWPDTVLDASRCVRDALVSR